MNKQEEINHIHQVLIHPSGYGVDNRGTILVRRYEWPKWAVEWEVWAELTKVVEFDDPLEAATFFVNKRHQLKIGWDY